MKWRACITGGMCSGGMHGRGHLWQERMPLQWMVRILLECILVVNISYYGFRSYVFPKMKIFQKIYRSA